MHLLLHGGLGRMGQEVQAVAKEEKDIVLFPVDTAPPCHTLEDLEQTELHIILDFSHPLATDDLLAFAKKKGLPLVIATTGHNQRELSSIVATAQKIPILLCKNLSLGALLFFDFAKTLFNYFPLGKGEILEIHRTGKKDLPSGTAKALKEDLIKICQKGDDIPIRSLRIGDTVGTHSFSFGSEEESITLTHRVHHRRLFAKVGIAACRYLLKQPAGLYTLEDMVKADET